MAIIVGIVIALVVGERRWIARGGRTNEVADVAMWAVPFGIVGGRLYHVITNPELYFGQGREPIRALYIWEGGLGIWGAVVLGSVGAYIGCRRLGIRFAPFADALAPAVALAQAAGRWGNYFNQELFGRATDLPWALKITRTTDGNPPGLYHPTFLYESIWNVGVAVLVIWADRRFALGRGRAFALYVLAYTVGRLWIEALRVDHANQIFGVRLNVWTSLLVMVGALVYLIRRRGAREENVYLDASPVATDGASGVPDSASVGSDRPDPTAQIRPGTASSDQSKDAPLR